MRSGAFGTVFTARFPNRYRLSDIYVKDHRIYFASDELSTLRSNFLYIISANVGYVEDVMMYGYQANAFITTNTSMDPSTSTDFAVNSPHTPSDTSHQH